MRSSLRILRTNPDVADWRGVLHVTGPKTGPPHRENQLDGVAIYSPNKRRFESMLTHPHAAPGKAEKGGP
jgi:hypothetical protein